MPSLGAPEIIIILVLALLVFGPSRLPEMGRSLGRGIREFKKASDTARKEFGVDQIEQELKGVKTELKDVKGKLTDVKGDLKVDVDAEAAKPAAAAGAAVAGAAAAGAAEAGVAEAGVADEVLVGEVVDEGTGGEAGVVDEVLVGEMVDEETGGEAGAPEDGDAVPAEAVDADRETEEWVPPGVSRDDLPTEDATAPTDARPQGA